jgi:DNA-binding PadR family transcriptional regulator
MLNKLNAKGLITCRKELQKGRVRKIYEITKDGRLLLQTYYSFLTEQILRKTTNESLETRK